MQTPLGPGGHLHPSLPVPSDESLGGARQLHTLERVLRRVYRGGDLQKGGGPVAPASAPCSGTAVVPRLFCAVFELSQVLRWTGGQAEGGGPPQGTHRGDIPWQWALRPTHTNEMAVIVGDLFYLLEQIYFASFSAFPQFSPSVSRPTLFTGKQ